MARRLPFGILLCAWLHVAVSAQSVPTPAIVDWRYDLPFRMMLYLPQSGPAAAPLNPARLADAAHFYFYLGETDFGRGGSGSWQLGTGSLGGLHIGLQFSDDGSSIPNSNAVVLNNIYTLPLAFSLPLDDKGTSRLEFGASGVWHQINLFGVWRGTSFTPAFGMAWIGAPLAGLGHLDLGLGMNDIIPTKGYAPVKDTAHSTVVYPHSSLVEYTFYSWYADATVTWHAPGERLGAFSTVDFASKNGSAYPEDGLSQNGVGPSVLRAALRSYGVDALPWPWMGLRLQRVWNAYWSAGLRLHLKPLVNWNVTLASDLSEGRFLEHQIPDRSGWILSFAFQAGG